MAVTWREKMFGNILTILSCAGTGFTVARFTKQMTGDTYAHTRSGVHAIERGERRVKHKFNLWYDLLLPILNKVVGKKYGCCDKIKNCHKCCVKNGYDEW